jgi:hypothetical protein
MPFLRHHRFFRLPESHVPDTRAAQEKRQSSFDDPAAAFRLPQGFPLPLKAA